MGDELVHTAKQRHHWPRKKHAVEIVIGRAHTGNDSVILRQEGHGAVSFRMKDVHRIEQKKTKGKRDGRLHIHMSNRTKCYRLDFDNATECAEAADALQEHRSHKAPTAIKLRVCTWNMGNALPQVRALRMHTARAPHMHRTCTTAHAPHTCARASRETPRPPAG